MNEEVFRQVASSTPSCKRRSQDIVEKLGRCVDVEPYQVAIGHAKPLKCSLTKSKGTSIIRMTQHLMAANNQ
jgi:hypothetical protein